MNATEVAKWERAKQICAACHCTYHVRNRLELYGKNGLTLGHFDTVAEFYSFLCGYEHAATARRIYEVDG